MSTTPTQDKSDDTTPPSKAIVVAASTGIFVLVAVTLFAVLFVVGLLAGPAWRQLEVQNGAAGASAIIAAVVACIIAFGVVWHIALDHVRAAQD